MPRKTLGIITIIVIVVAGGIIYLITNNSASPNNESMQQTSQSTPPSENQPETQQPASNQEAGSYIDYREGLIGTTSGTTLLFFHASWCPQCRELDADIQANSVPAGVTIVKVDYDSNQGLRQRYGVTIQTTLVKIDGQGNLLQKYVAYDDPSLSAVKDNLL